MKKTEHMLGQTGFGNVRMLMLTLFLSSPVCASYHEKNEGALPSVHYYTVENKAVPFQIDRQGLADGGIVSDIVSEIFKGGPYKLNVSVYPLNRLYQVASGDQDTSWLAYDAKVWNALSEWAVMIEEPLFRVHHHALRCNTYAHSGQNLQDGGSWAVLDGFDYPELEAKQKNGEIRLVRVRSYKQGFELVRLGRVNGFVEMAQRIGYHLKMNNIDDACLYVENLDNMIEPYDIHLTLSEGSHPELRQFIESRIKQLKATGAVSEIIRHYIGVRGEPTSW